MQHPYMQTDDNVAQGAEISSERYDATLNFISDAIKGKEALDIGVFNPFTKQLQERFELKVTNTEGDLDEAELSGEFDVVFCFEVVEHLFNPLFHLQQIHKALRPDGRLYLSTPKHKPYFLWFKYHFHEFHKQQLLDLIHYAGFKVVRMELARVHPWGFYFTGVRPFLRMIFERTWIIECEKAQ